MKKATIIFLFFGITFSSFGQKNILIEKFTNLYCGGCPNASIILGDLEEEYPELIWVSHYWPASFEYNPLPYPGAAEMWSDVSISGTPSAIVDRTPHTNNSLGTNSASWETRIQQQQNIEDYVDIEINEVAFDNSNRMLTFDVVSTFHTLPTDANSFRVFAYVTEDNVIWRQHSYYNNTAGHPLEGLGDVIQQYSHQNLLRNMLGGNWGTENIIPDNPIIGESYTKTFSYQVPGDYDEANFELTAAVSQHDESDVKNRPILNAERVQLSDFISTSTNETTLSNFNAYPNPANGVINLQFQEIPEQILLLDIEGRQLKIFAVTGLEAQIDLRNMPAGQYILKVVDGEKSISQKIIKQ